MDWIEIVRSKGILTNNNIVLYFDKPNDSIKVANLLNKLGYK